MNQGISLAPYLAELDRIVPFCFTGQVTEVVGLLIESRGPSAAIGDFCEVLTSAGRRIRTQVIGFRDGRVLSMPLEETDGLQLGDAVTARSERDLQSLKEETEALGVPCAVIVADLARRELALDRGKGAEYSI